jgi:hypothetical protein
LLAACFTLHSINATLAIVPQRGSDFDFDFVFVFGIPLSLRKVYRNKCCRETEEEMEKVINEGGTG